jgi:hypothetical protein
LIEGITYRCRCGHVPTAPQSSHALACR